MKLIQTLKNIWKIEELRKRITITFLFVLVYRFGCHVVLPGLDPTALQRMREFTQQSGLMQLIDMFSGGAFSQASVFALGIMPYITASIVIQLLGMVLPSFQKMQREGESGRMKLNQYTRYLTVFILAVQAPAYLLNLNHQVNGILAFGLFDIIYLTIVLTAGSMFIMWLGEKITDKGIGNGISMIILVGIIARFPSALAEEFTSRLTTAQGGLVMFLVEIILLFAVTAGAVMLTQGTRKVPVQYAKRIIGNKQYGGARQYIPLKLFAANVMPIIFAMSIMSLPATIGYFFGVTATSGHAFWSDFIALFSTNNVVYAILYFFLIIGFNYFYIAMQYNPVQIANDLKKNNGAIPGYRPGKPTSDYLSRIFSKLTLFGAVFLAILAVIPTLFTKVTKLTSTFSATGLLIMVSVALETAQLLEAQMMMRHYKGFLN
mgnify:CR=1 FL=1